MSNNKNTKILVVTGDLTIDWNIARVKQSDIIRNVWNAEDLTTAFCQKGGVAMLANLIKSIAANLNKNKKADIKVKEISSPKVPINPCNKNFHHSYAVWAPFKLDESKSDSEKVWRVQDFLGLCKACSNTSLPNNLKEVTNDPTDADIVVLDDAALGFRDNDKYWPKSILKGNLKPWILLKMARPVAKGKLWNHLLKNYSDKLIVVMTVDDLRKSQVHISRQVSWERTAQDLVWETMYNPNINEITRCAYAIISFNTAGAVLLSRKPGATLEATLFFDPNVMEGEWGRLYKGYMIGYSSCLTGSIARELMLNIKEPNIPRSIQSGVNAIRFLHMIGYGAASIKPKISLTFPAANIADKLDEDCNILASVPIKNPAKVLSNSTDQETPGFWTILEDKNPTSLESVARLIVREGLEDTLPEVPIGKFKKLKTVDRSEIEALHNISNLIGEYCNRSQKEPLSIAVFGPPGAGKSFAVREVATSVRKEEIEVLNFNLSQLEGPEDLLDAYHQIRDKGLSGKISLVFWDEFDTTLKNQPLGWLRYFLAPMQDGIFQEGQITHHIGRCIFVFAGGTSHSMEAFGANLSEKEIKVSKLPDFISRLKGFLNILGPNQKEAESAQGKTKDPYYIIRRAIIFRSIFERFTPQLLRKYGKKEIISIDEGVLLAFLLTKEYKHGARSIEAIVSMSQLAGRSSFEPSSLPSEVQLDVHVDGSDFYTLVHHLELSGDLLERLAQAAHEIFCEDLHKKGYKPGKVTLESKKEHSSLKPYSELPEYEKESNRNNVKDIPNKLASVGYAMIPVRGNVTPSKFKDSEVDKLAEMEHERWMQEKINTGWKFSKTTDKKRKLHQCLVNWDKLLEKEKEKDRVLIRGIPKILGKAGYVMVKIS
jgi:hypothetical protein